MTPVMVTDEQLMLEVQQGSKPAFAELFERYRDAVYRFFRRRLLDPARAEELAQETFLAVLRGLARYEPRAPVRAYLYGIAFNQLNAERRKRARANNFDQASTAPQASGDLDQTLAVREALGKLDAEAREVLLLREYEQLSYAEIAELLSLPLNTVRSRLFRARLAIKEVLEPAERSR